VIGRAGEHYRVDIGDRFEALLQFYDFEGATKRNRPMLESNSLVYARVLTADKHSQALLTCKSPTNPKSWFTGEAQYGLIKAGLLIKTPVSTCQQLLSAEGREFLNEVGQLISYELIVGYNGRVWLNANDPFRVVVLSNALLSELGPDTVAKLRTALKSQPRT
jgi:exosome complex component RRP40